MYTAGVSRPPPESRCRLKAISDQLGFPWAGATPFGILPKGAAAENRRNLSTPFAGIGQKVRYPRSRFLLKVPSPLLPLLARFPALLVMTMLDSVAVFESRAQEIGSEPLEIEELRVMRWYTFGAFAFTCGYAPGGPVETRLLQLAYKVTRSGALDPARRACRQSGAFTLRHTPCVPPT